MWLTIRESYIEDSEAFIHLKKDLFNLIMVLD